MILGNNEAFSRIIIDKALEASDWDLLESHQVQFEQKVVNGRVDYLLQGQPRPSPVRA
jgi:predicted type IV restriction endonuclease